MASPLLLRHRCRVPSHRLPHTNTRLVHLGSLSRWAQPTGRRLSLSHCQPHEPYGRRVRTGADNTAPLWVGGIPRPLTTTCTPRRLEHNISWVLTFSTSSLQSCRGATEQQERRSVLEASRRTQH